MKRTCCRKRHAAGAVASGIALALMPKCPVCVAGYLAVLTGVGISTATAGWLRAAMVTVLAAVLVSFSCGLLRRIVESRRNGGHG